MNNPKLVVGIAGTLLAGKGIVVDFLKAKGFKHASVRDIIKEELVKLDREPSRKNMQDMGNEMREKFGAHYWMNLGIQRHSNESEPLIIESIRNPKEVEFLRANFNFFLVGVDAPLDVRWQRMKKRKMDMDLKDYDTFIADDARDRGLNEPESGQNTEICIKQADFLITNDENLEQFEGSKLHNRLEELYNILLSRS